MRYQFTEDQNQINDMLSGFFADRYDAQSREAILANADGWSPDIWNSFAQELGILGLTFPEASGGVGGDAFDAMLLMNAAGSVLVVEPLLETCVMGAALLRRSSSPLSAELMEAAVRGDARFAFGIDEATARYAPFTPTLTAVRSADGYVLNGQKSMVIAMPAASHVFVTSRIEGEDGLAIFAMPADQQGVTSRKGRTLDGKGVSQLSFADCKVPEAALLVTTSDGEAVLSKVIDSAIAAICSEAVGIMRRLLRDTLEYLQQRKQFGTALIDFQVLQHRLADMQVHYEHSQAMAFFAANMIVADDRDSSVNISAAKVQICSALRAVAQEAVQMHGAMGITDELAIGHFFKRATALENEFGSIDYHLGKVANAQLTGDRFSVA